MVFFKKSTTVTGEDRPLRDEKQPNYLKEGLKPLITLFRCLAIPFDPVNPFSKRQKYRLIDVIYKVTMFVLFFINIYTNTLFTITSFNVFLFKTDYSTDIPELAPYSSMTDSFNMILQACTFQILVISSHAVLISFLWQSKWKSIWNNLETMAAGNLHNGYQLKKKCLLFNYTLIVLFAWVNL